MYRAHPHYATLCTQQVSAITALCGMYLCTSDRRIPLPDRMRINVNCHDASAHIGSQLVIYDQSGVHTKARTLQP